MKYSQLPFLYIFIVSLLFPFKSMGEDGYKLWLRYAEITDPAHKYQVSEILSEICLLEDSPTAEVISDELRTAAHGMVNSQPQISSTIQQSTGLIIALKETFMGYDGIEFPGDISTLNPEGYYIGPVNLNNNSYLAIIGSDDNGLLYGTFHFLRLLQMEDDLPGLPLTESPKIKHRLLNHWDNLDRTVERGYAGFSIWDWHKLPDYIDPRYIDYARANSSIGINGTVLTNVNANAWVLTSRYIEKVAALADAFRPYGLKVYLTARFSAPIELDNLATADPLNEDVRAWWKEKVKEIYRQIPDFGGFLVKANSEGQPGPQDYGRSHADGANMLAEALDPYGGIVMWRAFVYSHEVPEDRAKQANMEFEPLDGQFHDNVFVQVKNGPIDFQPREPFHPLFGAMPQTPLALELQITQEYLGQGTHLAYMGPLFEECLDSDTYAKGEGSTVAKVVDGSLDNHSISAIAGVSNVGTDRNWTGHLFGQSNWYAFGRLAWDHDLASGEIAEEWIRLTFGNEGDKVENIKRMMMLSREAVVNYMTPLGLHHIMAEGHHYGPGPWVDGIRPDWTSVYYHRADSGGIGFDRTESGSNAISLYAEPLQQVFSDPQTCPEKYLLWFHHLPWDYRMKSGRTLWEELCIRYDLGDKQVEEMIDLWMKMKHYVDAERFNQVKSFLDIQQNEAKWWKSSCLLYFQQFSGMDFPDEIEPPKGGLEEFMSREFPYAPGI